MYNCTIQNFWISFPCKFFEIFFGPVLQRVPRWEVEIKMPLHRGSQQNLNSRAIFIFIIAFSFVVVNRIIVSIDWGGGLLPTLFSWAGNLWDCNEGLQHLRVYEPCETCESRPNCGTLTILISTKMRFVKEMWTQPTQSHWVRKYCQCCLFYCSARFLGFMENSEMSHFVDVVKHHSWENSCGTKQ